jgi:thiosulfate reductase cytochrome b subunit
VGSEPIERNAQAPPPSDWDRLDRILDEALAGTFPASDPVAICTDTVVGPAARQTNRTEGGAAAKRALRPAYHYQRHSLLVRLTHWINAVAAALLLMSGLQIFNAHPNLYWGDSSYSKHAAIFVVTAGEKASGAEIGVTRIFGRNFNTSGILGLSREDGNLTERAFPPWITIPSNQWLAMGRRWHLLFAWVLVINGIVYVVHSVLSRHFSNDLAPTRRDWRSIGRSVLDHLRLRHPLGEAARHYNILQKLTYLMVIFVTAVYGADGLRHVAAAGFIRWRLGGFSRWEANRAHTAFHRRLDFGVVRADSCVRGHRHWPVEQHPFNDYRSLQSSAAAGRIGGEPWRFLMARSGGFFVFRSEG